MLQRLQHGHPIDDLNPVATAAEMLACQEAIREIHVDDKVRKLHSGNRPRHARRTKTCISAAVRGRRSRCSARPRRWRRSAAAHFVLPDDVKHMVQPVLGHRLILRPESRLRKVTTPALLDEIVSEVRVPVPSHQDDDAADDYVIEDD